MPKDKIRIDLTGKQIEFLNECVSKTKSGSYMYKKITEILKDAILRNEKQEQFYKEKNYHKAFMKTNEYKCQEMIKNFNSENGKRFK